MHPFHEHVAHHGYERPAFARFVAQIDFDRCQLHVADLDVAHEDILDEATAHGIRLQAQTALELGAVETALLCENVSRAARDFAPDRDAAVTGLHLTTADDDVFDRNIQAPAVRIASRLQGDAIVAGVED